ncbi:homoserine kinase [Natronosporangium hydrolyticum]|uniref:Homoserine kinase n=1 Tax=Natronosporangium hydrolyticum TaxID=2811111 RepID=A0A895YMC9_9ACTN|nr:homoserine kinase [Natronosporangium hydrolyticum]
MVVSVRAPATSANLGPGFDALGLALTWYDEVTGRLARETTVTVHGEGAGELPGDDRHLVVRAIHATFAQLGMPPAPVALTCQNRIPQARGLGSSSAAIVAGVLLGRELAGAAGGALDQPALLRIAAGLEGHPDNVAPCLLGGFTVAWRESSEPDSARAVTVAPADSVRPVLFVPDHRSLTTAARAALPDQVPHRDAAHSAGRAALLVHAVTRDPAPSLLLAATEDRLHQQYRAAAAPATAALVARLRAAGVPAVVSGAGPSVLAFGPVPEQLSSQVGWVCQEMSVDQHGATVRPDMMPAYTG